MIEFNKFNRYNVLVYKDSIHIATIRNSIYGIRLDINDKIQLDILDIDVIRHEMFRTMRTEFIKLLNEKLKQSYYVQFDPILQYFILSNTNSITKQDSFFYTIDNLLEFIREDLKVAIDDD